MFQASKKPRMDVQLSEDSQNSESDACRDDSIEVTKTTIVVYDEDNLNNKANEEVRSGLAAEAEDFDVDVNIMMK
uniref:Uncharacterized protein n=1 Tax=Acartia pacifica TaxID=335913 RepID=A0A0U2TGW7_ACAPC|nr:hypothetical protein [Acartia pacifica]